MAPYLQQRAARRPTSEHRPRRPNPRAPPQNPTQRATAADHQSCRARSLTQPTTSRSPGSLHHKAPPQICAATTDPVLDELMDASASTNPTSRPRYTLPALLDAAAPRDPTATRATALLRPLGFSRTGSPPLLPRDSGHRPCHLSRAVATQKLDPLDPSSSLLCLPPGPDLQLQEEAPDPAANLNPSLARKLQEVPKNGISFRSSPASTRQTRTAQVAYFLRNPYKHISLGLSQRISLARAASQSHARRWE